MQGTERHSAAESSAAKRSTQSRQPTFSARHVRHMSLKCGSSPGGLSLPRLQGTEQHSSDRNISTRAQQPSRGSRPGYMTSIMHSDCGSSPGGLPLPRLQGTAAQQCDRTMSTKAQPTQSRQPPFSARHVRHMTLKCGSSPGGLSLPRLQEQQHSSVTGTTAPEHSRPSQSRQPVQPGMYSTT
jgi:hypothetical protein